MGGAEAWPVKLMLSRGIRPINFENESWGKEPWEDFRKRLDLPNDYAIEQFYRQVVYDHFDHFNDHYPDFELSDYEIGIECLTAQEANERIRFFGNKEMDKWGQQYDSFEQRNQGYVIYQKMSKSLTPPFPPILIDSSLLVDSGWRVYGRPLHLVEGTHRVSYLRRMLERGIIASESRHQFVVLLPRRRIPLNAATDRK